MMAEQKGGMNPGPEIPQSPIGAGRGGIRLNAIDVPTRPGSNPDERRTSTTPTLPRPEAPPVPAQETPLTDALADGIIKTRKIDNLPKRKNKLPLKVKLGFATGGLLAFAGGVWGINRTIGDDKPTPQVASQSQSADSFPNSFNSEALQPIEIFDNTAAKGIKSERNTIEMTREEYEKIAPPAIDRTNAKEVSVTLNIHPQPDGRTTNDLTLELGTTVNAMIYVKTPEGKIRDTTYAKIPDSGGIGKGPAGFVFPNCRTLLGLEEEIQDGDIFPAPITGRVYYSGSTVEDPKGETQGKVIIGDYVIEGQYYDPKTNKTFEAFARVSLLYTKTQPLIENIPNRNDEAFKEKVKGIDSSGKEVEVMATNKDKIPVVMVQQGEDLFRFVSKPQAQNFSRDFKTKPQLVVSTTYWGDFRKNGTANPFGGENCNHPTVDNKAIVLK